MQTTFALLTVIVTLLAGAGLARPQTTLGRTGSALTDDFKYLADNAQLDLIDIATAPLHAADPDSALRSPRFYLVLTAAGALWGGSYALDQTMRSHLRSMSSNDADLLQNTSYGTVAAASALLYGYGLYADDQRARQFVLTAGEGAGIATLLDLGIKAAFGRLRPTQSSSRQAFFAGGHSFVSGDVAPMFALAAGVSEYFDNRWYVAAPIYSLALLDGFGRMGHDAHWFSDVVGAGLLGWGTTELFIHLHRQHELEPDRWRIFPISAPPGPASQNQSPFTSGLGLSYSW